MGWDVIFDVFDFICLVPCITYHVLASFFQDSSEAICGIIVSRDDIPSLPPYHDPRMSDSAWHALCHPPQAEILSDTRVRTRHMSDTHPSQRPLRWWEVLSVIWDPEPH